MKILLVDDDSFLRDMYATKFRESGDEISVAEDGNEALQMIEENSYDAIITDMVMPGVTGLDVLKHAKQSGASKQSACIILSNQGEESDIDAAMKAGADGYIIKAELIPSQVVEKVHSLITK